MKLFQKFLRFFCAGFTINFDQQDDISQSSDAKDLGEEPFALPSSSKWEVADRQEKMGKDNFIVNIIKIAKFYVKKKCLSLKRKLISNVCRYNLYKSITINTFAYSM